MLLDARTLELLVIALVIVVAFAASTAFLWRSQSPFWRRVCSLHGRADTRIFAKQVRGGRSRHQLSTKEEDAVRQALTQQQA